MPTARIKDLIYPDDVERLVPETRTLTGFFAEGAAVKIGGGMVKTLIFHKEADDFLGCLATKKRCECGSVNKISHCDKCYMEKRRQRWLEIPVESYSGGCVFTEDRHFIDLDAAIESRLSYDECETLDQINAYNPLTAQEYRQSIIRVVESREPWYNQSEHVRMEFDLQDVLERFYEDCGDVEVSTIPEEEEAAKPLADLLRKRHSYLTPVENARIDPAEIADCYIEMMPFEEFQEWQNETAEPKEAITK